MSCPEDPQWVPDSRQICLWKRRVCPDQVQPWLLLPWWLCRGDSDLSRTEFLGCFTGLCLWVKLLKSGANWQVLNIWCSNNVSFIFFLSPLFFPGESEGSGSTPVISYGRVTAGQKPSYSVGDFITIECYTGYTLHGEAQIQYIGDNQWVPAVPTCQLSEYGQQNSTGMKVHLKKQSFIVRRNN